MEKSISIEVGDVGFCGGVERADNLIKKIRENEKDTVYILGELIHNSAYNNNLRNQGILTINTIEEARDKIVVIRTHGISPEEEKILHKISKKVYDLTCPLVKTIQNKALEYSNKGYFIVIVGDKKHAETIGIKGYTKNSIVVKSLEEVKNLELKDKEKVVALVQSTFSQDKFIEIVDILKSLKEDIIIDNTLCYAPTTRQDEMSTLARQNDMVIIIGGKHSSNTVKLYEKALKESITKKVFHIEDLIDAKEIDFNGVSSVGIASGTSTPVEIINDVIELVKSQNVETSKILLEKI